MLNKRNEHYEIRKFSKFKLKISSANLYYMK